MIGKTFDYKINPVRPYKKSEVAKLLCCSEETVMREVEDGKLTVSYWARTMPRFFGSEILKYQENNKK